MQQVMEVCIVNQLAICLQAPQDCTFQVRILQCSQVLSVHFIESVGAQVHGDKGRHAIVTG